MLVRSVGRIPLTLEEEFESLDAFMKLEKTRRLDLTPDLDEVELEKTLRAQWSGFDFATQRSYLSSKLAIFGLEAKDNVSWYGLRSDPLFLLFVMYVLIPASSPISPHYLN